VNEEGEGSREEERRDGVGCGENVVTVQGEPRDRGEDVSVMQGGRMNKMKDNWVTQRVSSEEWWG